MDRTFLNARSPLRVLEKSLHGGLGAGNLGVVVAAHGVGKTSFLVGVALDDLLRGQDVLHVALDQTVSHVRAYYDTVFDDLASSTHLEDIARVHADVDRHRRIRAYPPAAFDAAKLREAVKLEAEAGANPSLIVLEGCDLASAGRDELAALKALASELQAEIWLSVVNDGQRHDMAGAVGELGDLVSVVLALEPASGHVALRVLKDHENPDVSKLHVALDPKSLLLVRS
jgi:hypothetical protein